MMLAIYRLWKVGAAAMVLLASLTLLLSVKPQFAQAGDLPDGGPMMPAPATSEPVLEPPPGIFPTPILTPVPIEVGPMIDEFESLIEWCEVYHDPGREILSYRVWNKVTRIQIKAFAGFRQVTDGVESDIVYDERVIYEVSAPPGETWAERTDRVRDPGPLYQPDHGYTRYWYVLTVWGKVTDGETSRSRVVYVDYRQDPEFEIAPTIERQNVKVDGELHLEMSLHILRLRNVDPDSLSMGWPPDTQDSWEPLTSDTWDGPILRIVRDTSLPFWEPLESEDPLRLYFQASGPCGQLVRSAILPPQDSEPPEEPEDPELPESPGPVRAITICANSPIPDGYILVNDSHDFTRCGSPASDTYNVWELHYYADRPVGWKMSVCDSAQTPVGWVETGRYHNSLKCSRPSSSDVLNVKEIERATSDPLSQELPPVLPIYLIGDLQDELGCIEDWERRCLHLILTDEDGDGQFDLMTTDIPSGDYEVQVVQAKLEGATHDGELDETLSETITIHIEQDGAKVTFSFDSASGELVVQVSPSAPEEEESAFSYLVYIPMVSKANDAAATSGAILGLSMVRAHATHVN